MIVVYGIRNCDKVKKTLNKLRQLTTDYNLYDFKKKPPTSDLILKWQNHFGDWPINKRGTTYRKIKESFEASSESNKINLIISNSSVIIRPIIEKQGKIISIGNMSEIESYLDEI